MPVWRDPLDELIADLERLTPIGTEQAFEMPPPIEDYSIFVQSVLSRDPVERARLAEDPATGRVQEYHRLVRTDPSSDELERPV
jgi:hypothetical protein